MSKVSYGKKRSFPKMQNIVICQHHFKSIHMHWWAENVPFFIFLERQWLRVKIFPSSLDGASSFGQSITCPFKIKYCYWLNSGRSHSLTDSSASPALVYLLICNIQYIININMYYNCNKFKWMKTHMRYSGITLSISFRISNFWLCRWPLNKCT